MDELSKLFKDFGYLGVGAAGMWWAGKGLYLMASQRNGNRPASLKDVVEAINKLIALNGKHAEDETKHHEKQEEMNHKMLESINRLMGRGE